MKAFISSLLAVIVLSAVGCGGGGGGAVSNMTGTLGLAVTEPESAGLPGAAVATYSNPNTSNPQGVKISFVTDRPDIVKIASPEATVGSDGKATTLFTFIAVPTDTTAVIYASAGGLKQFVTLTITGTPGAPVEPPPVSATANSINFISANPATIALKGMGGAGSSETSDVAFQVKDANNAGLKGVVVDFSLSTAIGGITISPAFGTTDDSGYVQTKVYAGIISTPIVVTATVRGTSIATSSTQLVIKSGLPDQDSLSISLSDFNVEGWNIDGKEVTVTARLADHFNNQVPDGTAVYFTTEGGVVDPFCTTDNGVCSVTWTSQDPRPAGGRVTILAYAIGEESFTDTNGNGKADTGACVPTVIAGVGAAQQCGEFIDTPEAFRDDDLSGTRGPFEPFIDFNSNIAYNSPDGIFNGLLRPAAVVGATSKHIFYNSELVMSSSVADITSDTDPITPDTLVTITVKDLNGNLMPSGTTIKITLPAFGTASGTTTATVPKSTSTAGTKLTFTIAPAASPVLKNGLATVTVTTPGGVVTETSFAVSGLF